MGAGIDKTVIFLTSGITGVIYSPTNPDENGRFRISRFTIDGAGIAGTAGIRLRNSSHANYLTNIVIDNLKIANCTNGLYLGDENYGLVYGVAHHLMVANCSAHAIRFYGKESYSWNTPANPGSTEAFYVEDSTFANNGMVFDATQGAKFVFRSNFIDASGTGDPLMDAHGNLGRCNGTLVDSWYGNGRGTVLAEIYDNTIVNFNRSQGRLYDHRGGTGIVFNNTVTGTIAGCNNNITIREEDDNAVVGSCFPLKSTRPGYDPVKNTYIWNNKLNGNPLCVNNEDDTVMILDQVDFWSDSKELNLGTSTYFAKGSTFDRVTPCTERSIYWDSELNLLYRCSSSNNWEAVYAPYVYPHPLTINWLANPKNLRIVP